MAQIIVAQKLEIAMAPPENAMAIANVRPLMTNAKRPKLKKVSGKAKKIVKLVSALYLRKLK
nr:hypothetical protein [Holzapfeliella floricola]